MIMLVSYKAQYIDTSSSSHPASFTFSSSSLLGFLVFAGMQDHCFNLLNISWFLWDAYENLMEPFLSTRTISLFGHHNVIPITSYLTTLVLKKIELGGSSDSRHHLSFRSIDIFTSVPIPHLFQNGRCYTSKK